MSQPPDEAARAAAVERTASVEPTARIEAPGAGPGQDGAIGWIGAIEDPAEERIRTAAREAETALSLAGLGLTELPESLRALRYLVRLDLTDNLLTELPEWIGELTALELLVLRGNRLSRLPARLAALTRLTQLDAAGNRLLQVAPELANMPRLAAIELRGNPHLLVPPPEIVARGSNCVLEYLRGRDGAPASAASAIESAPPSLPPPRTFAESERRHGKRHRALLIGVPVLAVGVVVAITAAVAGSGSGQTASLPAGGVSRSVNTVAVSPDQSSSNAATGTHASTPTPTHPTATGHTSPAAPRSSMPPTSAATATTAAAGTPTTTAAGSSFPVVAPTVDLALGRPATGSSVMQNYVAANVVDGDPNTYWESQDGAAFPQTLTVDLGEVTTVGRFEFALPQAIDWYERTETFTVLGSTNGSGFFTIAPSAVYTFNADSPSDDTASLSVGPVHARYIELYFTATGGWPAAQRGELDVYS